MHAYACVLFFVEILLQLKAENIFDYYTKNQVNSNRFVGNIEIKDNENGFLINRDVEELENKIINLYDNRDLLKAMSVKVKSDYLQWMDNKITIEHIKKVL